ncbi:hypothetical protein IEN85_17680 [Pelagicoccus sp. NFK12]|uniref:Beta-barrel porin 2 n=1 Tax=Pelagicoccus enzymogenes TaxID=2773457 RepID=A0A927IIJ6_9BACT|nr:hypothetical protein [Pelagicoccus enzymogenes]MBD5781336.1 hypothetical protein [Pelagicoccus enzymogenes]
MTRICLAAALAVIPSGGTLGNEDPFTEFSGETSLSLGYGYAENVLYSEIAPVDSAFLLASLEGYFEGTIFSDSLDWNAMGFVEHRSFESDEHVPSQTIALLQSQVEGYAGLYSKWRLGGRYLGLEQAFDATFDVLDRNTFLVKAKEPELFLGWKSLFLTFEYDAEIGLSRMEFDQEGSDYDSFNWEVEIDQRIVEGLNWKSGIFGYERNYLDRAARDLDGSTLPDTLMNTRQLGFETGLEYERQTEAADHKLSLMLGERRRRDLAFGYYDRSRRSVLLQWQIDWKATSLRLESDFGAYRYDAQLGEDDRLQRTDSWSWTLELERRLSERWGVFLWATIEDEDSNASFFSYEANSLSLGLRWLK